MNKIIIAIDGSSSCGKSTLARTLARKLGYRFIDTGAMYRAVTLYILENNVDIKDAEQIALALSRITISFENINGQNTAFLNGTNVEKKIRTMRISHMVSEIARIPEVRRFLVAQQHVMGKDKGIVMDGRDIGSVVFPSAELKLFISASLESRTERRAAELIERGESITKEAVRENLKKRDLIDSTRADSPLIRAKDAIGLDTTHLTRDQMIEIALQMVKNLID
ncbi:MAG: (d)CMP kinase [Bacteroidia bacterium]|nr:(d)CMP kinase [Bacteroidia bacterium]